MSAVFAVDACRTPIGKIKGALAEVRPDHLTAQVMTALLARNAWLDPQTIDDVYWAAANQAGEDNRNVARMGVLLAGLPVEVPGATVNRLCGSGMEAISSAARAIAAGDADICIAGGTESMTRAPFVLPRPAEPFPRYAGVVDTLLGWGLAGLLRLSRRAQPAVGAEPRARYSGSTAAGVHPDYMGIGPVPAMTKALNRSGWQLGDLALVEVNEAFAAQAVAVIEQLKLDRDLVNVNGGAIAIGHPLGCSGARITTTLLHELRRRGGGRGAATMCIGVGQGIASLGEAP